MEIIRIEDPLDPRVAAYRDIRERDLVGRGGRFVAEGKVVLRVLFEARRFAVESVLLLDSRIEGMRETLALAPPGVPVYLARPSVMDAVAGFHLHRGILAIGRKPAPEPPSALLDRLPERAMAVVLIGLANHDNVGAIFRNAAAFGVDAVLLDRGSCDPLYRKAIRVSVGAALKVPFATAESDDLVIALMAARFELIALSPGGAEDIAAIRRADRTALLLGSEGEGLPRELMARLRTARIAMADGFDSLNVAAASAIALHRLAGRAG